MDVSRVGERVAAVGRLGNADAHASKALELATFVGSDSSRATAKLAQGRIAAARGEYAAAEAKIHEAIAVAVPRGFRPLLADALAGLVGRGWARVIRGSSAPAWRQRPRTRGPRRPHAVEGRAGPARRAAGAAGVRARPEPHAEGREPRSRTRSAGRTALEGSASAPSEAGKASPQPSCGWWSSSRKD